MTTGAPPSNKPRNIVVGFDFSEISERALQEALEIASRRAPAELHVVVVTMQSGPLLLLPEDMTPVTEDAARQTVQLRVAKVIDEYREKRGPVGIERVAVYLLTGLSPGQTGHLISEVAKEVDAELIVVGSHGRRGIQRVLLGSVAERVVREATTSVHVVRPADFVGSKKVPTVDPPLEPGQAHMKHFEHRRTYHYVTAGSGSTKRTMPAI